MLPVVAVPAIPKFSANGTVVIWPDAFSAILQPQTPLLEKHSVVDQARMVARSKCLGHAFGYEPPANFRLNPG